MLGELTKTLQLGAEQVCVLAALLGNFLLPENDLQDVYKRIIAKTNCRDSKVRNLGLYNMSPA